MLCCPSTEGVVRRKEIEGEEDEDEEKVEEEIETEASLTNELEPWKNGMLLYSI